MAQSGTSIDTPAAISLVNSGYDLAIDGVDTSQENCECFELEFKADTADLELEIYGFNYYIELRGELGF